MDCTVMYWWMDSDKEVDMDEALKLSDYILLLSPAQYLDYERFCLFIIQLFCFVHCMQHAAAICEHIYIQEAII